MTSKKNIMERKEYAIDEIFEYDGMYYKVMDNPECECARCAFDDVNRGCQSTLLCISDERTDHKDVYFEIVI